MKKKLLQKINAFLKGLGITAFAAFSVQQSIAQVQFGSLVNLNPNNTSTAISNANRVLYDGVGSTTDYLRSTVTNVNNVTVDNEGNVAVSYVSLNNILRKNKGSDNVIVFPVPNISNAGGVTTLAINKQDSEFIYYTYNNTNANATSESFGIFKYIWKDNGSNTSLGYYSGSAVGTTTNAVKSIPFLINGDQVFLNGALARSSITIGREIKAIVFDASGDIFYSDASNHAVRKISMVKTTGVGTSGSSSLELNSVSGLKVGDLISGLNIPTSTYIGSINVNTITLVTSDGVTPVTLTGNVDQTSSISFITGVTSIIGVFGTSGAGEFTSLASQFHLSLVATPNVTQMASLAFDQEGNLLVGDRGNNRIVKVVAPISGSSAVSSFATGLSEVGGLAVDVNNNVYVVEKSRQRIIKFTSAGGTANTATVIAGSGNRLTPNNPVRYTTELNSNVITEISDETIAKIQIGMLVRGDNILWNSVVTAINNVGSNNNSITISAAATKTETKTNNNGMLLTSANGFFTTETDKGYFDGPSAIALIPGTGNNFDMLVTEGSGFNVRVLKAVGTLPVTLSNKLTAKLTTSGAVNLAWASSKEVNNDYFKLQRSNDGVNYINIGKQESKGEEGASYSYTDVNAAVGINYYKLSQVDKDGKTTELGVVSVNVPTLTKKVGVTVYPNPINGSEFSINAKEIKTSVLRIRITNLAGKEVFASEFSKTEDGVYHVQLNQKPLSGIYLLTINGTETGKLIFQ